MLRLIASILCPSYRMRYNVLDWMADEPFERYLRFVGESGGLKSINAGRRWMIYQLLRLTDEVPGDTAECGVYLAASSYLICSFVARSELPKGHHLFDSFEGLSAPVPQDGSHWQANDLQIDFVNKPNGGLLVLPDATTNLYRELIIALAARYRVPDPDRPASCSRALSIFRRHRIG